MPLTIEYVRKFVEENSDSTLLSNEYKNNRTNLKFRCKCGNEFETRFDNFVKNKRTCYSCKLKTMKQCTAKTVREISEFIKNNSESVYVDGYINARSKMKLHCSCGDIFETTMLNFKLGKRKCNSCSKRIPHNKFCVEDIKKIISEESNCKYHSEFTDTSKSFKIECSCGNVFTTMLSNFRAGKKRCDDCTSKISNGELKIKQWLENNNVEFISQKRFKGCKDKRTLPFDFYLPIENMVIEFDGEQHYREHSFFQKREGLEDIKRRDEIKNDYCNTHNIQMLRISYKQIENIENLLNKYVNTEVNK